MHDFKTPAIVSYTSYHETEKRKEKNSSRGTTLTCFLVDAQLRDTRTRAPRCQLSHLIHQHCQGIVFLAQSQDCAQMLWQTLQSSDILANEFRRAVVVIDDCEDSIHHCMVGLQESNDDPKNNMRQGVGEVVELGSEKRADGGFVRSAAFGSREIFGEVALQQRLSVCGGQFGAGTQVPAQNIAISLGDHFVEGVGEGKGVRESEESLRKAINISGLSLQRMYLPVSRLCTCSLPGNVRIYIDIHMHTKD